MPLIYRGDLHGATHTSVGYSMRDAREELLESVPSRAIMVSTDSGTLPESNPELEEEVDGATSFSIVAMYWTSVVFPNP